MLLTFDKIKEKIENGETLILAGDEEILKDLPKGNWIGGTIPYFIDNNGGIFTKEKIFVTELPEYIKKSEIKSYNENNIKNITTDASENGFTFLIIPALSNVHLSYAQNAPNYKNIFLKPIIGWISGIAVEEIGKKTAKTINGSNKEISDQNAIAIHFTLETNKIAKIGIVNIFKQGNGDTITFEKESFSASECLINGAKTNFADYLLQNKIDTKMPLVADYSGAMINVSFQSINEKEKIVNFYAPVFKDVEYKIAAPISDYVKAFDNSISKTNVKSPVFSCNCILNYLYGGLENKKTLNLYGPITFGEIAYQLLNQTLVYLEIIDN